MLRFEKRNILISGYNIPLKFMLDIAKATNFSLLKGYWYESRYFSWGAGH